ncbi:MAG TPA: cation:proton antiporter [Terriglobales bacterium]|nr:cation:proton antiporter [Terriglobales bacterium]
MPAPLLAGAAGAAVDTPMAILELGALVLLAGILAWVARRVGLPSLVGFLAAGVVASPLTPRLSVSHSQLELVADLGVLLLLFESGIEIDFRRLRRSGLLLVVPAQVLLTTGLVAAAATALGLSVAGGVLLGAAVALSSTAVIKHIVNSRQRTTNPATDRAVEDWAAIEDLTGAALTAIALIAVGFEGQPGPFVVGRLGLYALVAVAAAWLLPRALGAFRAHGDLLVLLSVGGSLTLAGLGAAVFRLPLPLAAFLGGAVMGESPEMETVREQVRPFRELFAVLFFVALPTLIEPATLAGALGWLAFVLVALAAGKSVPVALLARLRPQPDVRPVQLALGLGQMGEFSFAIAVIAMDHGALAAPVFEAVLAALVASIALSTVLVRLGGPVRREGPG